jgi:hypothetical protein
LAEAAFELISGLGITGTESIFVALRAIQWVNFRIKKQEELVLQCFVEFSSV